MLYLYAIYLRCKYNVIHVLDWQFLYSLFFSFSRKVKYTQNKTEHCDAFKHGDDFKTKTNHIFNEILTFKNFFIFHSVCGSSATVSFGFTLRITLLRLAILSYEDKVVLITKSAFTLYGCILLQSITLVFNK